jgi:hypothetical protein
MKKNTLFTAVAVLALVGPLAAITRVNTKRHRNKPKRTIGATKMREATHAIIASAAKPGAMTAKRRFPLRRLLRNNRWTYGQPPEHRYRRPGFALGYRPWAVGQSLGPLQRARPGSRLSPPKLAQAH